MLFLYCTYNFSLPVKREFHEKSCKPTAGLLQITCPEKIETFNAEKVGGSALRKWIDYVIKIFLQGSDQQHEWRLKITLNFWYL